MNTWGLKRTYSVGLLDADRPHARLLRFGQQPRGCGFFEALNPALPREDFRFRREVGLGKPPAQPIASHADGPYKP